MVSNGHLRLNDASAGVIVAGMATPPGPHLLQAGRTPEGEAAVLVHPAHPHLRKAGRVLVGIAAMTLVIVAALMILTVNAGRWGVPYFSFTTDRGTQCTNTWGGYRCTNLTVADYNHWSDFALPDGTQLVKSSYTKNNADFQIDAQLRTDAQHAEAVGKALLSRYGACQKSGARPVELVGYTDVCLVNSDLTRGTQSSSLSRKWMVATGVAPDGSRLTVLSFGSR